MLHRCRRNRMLIPASAMGSTPWRAIGPERRMIPQQVRRPRRSPRPWSGSWWRQTGCTRRRQRRDGCRSGSGTTRSAASGCPGSCPAPGTRACAPAPAQPPGAMRRSKPIGSRWRTCTIHVARHRRAAGSGQSWRSVPAGSRRPRPACRPRAGRTTCRRVLAGRPSRNPAGGPAGPAPNPTSRAGSACSRRRIHRVLSGPKG